MHVLIVDDDSIQLLIYGEIVQNLGHTVTTVNSVAKAKLEFEHNKFDALITDMSMPQQSGYDLVSWIWGFRYDLPCLLHSMVEHHSTGEKLLNLNDIHTTYSFVTFKMKQIDRVATELYITEFLSGIQTI